MLFQEAEEMHIKAIQIKEQLLGQEDYEVALSVGHLASLYNYDMNQYEDAERLYLRSIAIGKRPLARGNSLREIFILQPHSATPIIPTTPFPPPHSPHPQGFVHIDALSVL